MITLYTWTTPNGRKISILLEELGLSYVVQPVNLGKGEQFAPSFLAISPNNKIPAIVDDASEDGPVTVFESGAILTYLAERNGRFLPSGGKARYKTLEWLHWQIGGIGPLFGQVGYFGIFAPDKQPAAIKRFTDEAERLLEVMDRQLQKTPWLAGDDYSIADIAVYPWVVSTRTYLHDYLGEIAAGKPAVQRWLEAVGARPAVQRGMRVPQL